MDKDTMNSILIAVLIVVSVFAGAGLLALIDISNTPDQEYQDAKFFELDGMECVSVRFTSRGYGLSCDWSER